MTVQVFQMQWLALRGYVVAFEAVGNVASDVDAFATRMARVLRRENAHLHGVFVPNHGFFYTRPVDPRTAAEDDHAHVVYTAEHALLAFKTVLLQGLATFTRPAEDWSPALETYFGSVARWQEKTPVSSNSSTR